MNLTKQTFGMRQFIFYSSFLIFFICNAGIFGQSEGKVGSTPLLTESEKIEYLIKSVEDLKGAKFYRNGTWYDSKAAADHLRMKLDKAGKRVKTAEDFIKYVGSCSSVSGKPYKIRFSDGTEVETRVYFTELLNKLDTN
jgi:hypothetical protein